MKVIFWFTIIFTTMLCFSAAIADERSVLKALEKVKVGLEREAPVKNLREFLADAKVELNITRRETKNKCFLSNAEKSYELYDKDVQHRIEAQLYAEFEREYKLLAREGIRRIKRFEGERAKDAPPVVQALEREEEFKKKKENAKKDLGEVKIKADLQLDKTYDCFK